METSLNLVFVFIGIINVAIILLFIYLFINVRLIKNESIKQTHILITIADKQGALKKNKCPYCGIEIITSLLDDSGIYKCESCEDYYQIENDTLVKTFKH